MPIGQTRGKQSRGRRESPKKDPGLYRIDFFIYVYMYSLKQDLYHNQGTTHIQLVGFFITQIRRVQTFVENLNDLKVKNDKVHVAQTTTMYICTACERELVDNFTLNA